MIRISNLLFNRNSKNIIRFFSSTPTEFSHTINLNNTNIPVKFEFEDNGEEFDEEDLEEISPLQQRKLNIVTNIKNRKKNQPNIKKNKKNSSSSSTTSNNLKVNDFLNFNLNELIKETKNEVDNLNLPSILDHLESNKSLEDYMKELSITSIDDKINSFNSNKYTLFNQILDDTITLSSNSDDDLLSTSASSTVNFDSNIVSSFENKIFSTNLLDTVDSILSITKSTIPLDKFSSSYTFFNIILEENLDNKEQIQIENIMKEFENITNLSSTKIKAQISARGNYLNYSFKIYFNNYDQYENILKYCANLPGVVHIH